SLSRTSMQKLVDAGVVVAVKTMGGHRRILRSSLMMKVPASTSSSQHAATLQRRRPDDSGFSLRDVNSNSAPLTVLIVEDDAATVALLESTLKVCGPEIVILVASDGLDAVLQLERVRPDILITDLNMQPFDGFKLINLVTSRSEFRHMSLIAISGLQESEISAKGGLPADVLFFAKPLDMSRIRGFTEAHLQMRRRQLVPA
ncbi:MAG: hypothetical protein RLZZ371_2262, partial [Pseudomonadota bacterium]